jgi:hypothetical protein
MKEFFTKLFRKEPASTDGFSRFFREASSSEKERVIGEAVRKSTEDQHALIERYHHVKTS